MGHGWRRRAGYRRTRVNWRDLGRPPPGRAATGGGQPIGGSRRRAWAEFSNGQAKATAVVTKVGPGVGDLSLALAAASPSPSSRTTSPRHRPSPSTSGSSAPRSPPTGAAPRRSRLTSSPSPPGSTTVMVRTQDASGLRTVAGETLGGGRGSAAATVPSATADHGRRRPATGPAVIIGRGKATASPRSSRAPTPGPATVDLDLKLAGGALELSGPTGTPSTARKETHAEATSDRRHGQASRVLRSSSRWRPPRRSSTPLSAETRDLDPHATASSGREADQIACGSPRCSFATSRAPGKATLGPGLNASRRRREQMLHQPLRHRSARRRSRR